MCEWGDTVDVNLKLAPQLSHTGKSYWRLMKIDRCIVDIVRALQAGGIDMKYSCCGHGKKEGEIRLQDGRTLIIKDNFPYSPKDVGNESSNR